MSYLNQGFFPLRTSAAALVIAEKDKPIRMYAIPGPVGLEFGIWEVPDSDNDEMFIPPKGFA